METKNKEKKTEQRLSDPWYNTVVGGIVTPSPKTYVHLEPQYVTSFDKRVFAAIIKVRIPP